MNAIDLREGCAFGPCRQSLERGGAGCRLCDRIAKIQQPVACGLPIKDGFCQLVKGHPSWVPCRGKRKPAADLNPERDGERPDRLFSSSEGGHTRSRTR